MRGTHDMAGRDSELLDLIGHAMYGKNPTDNGTRTKVYDALVANPDVVLRALMDDEGGPSLISEHPLFEDEPSGKVVQMWEVIV